MAKMMKTEMISALNEDEQYHEWSEYCVRVDEFSKSGVEENGKCCICKEFLSNPYGNNPEPVRKRGKCCDKCNYDKVIPARMGGRIDFGTWEEHLLTQKVLAFANFPALKECIHEDKDLRPEAQTLLDDFYRVIMNRGMFPILTFTEDKTSISFINIYEAWKAGQFPHFKLEK